MKAHPTPTYGVSYIAVSEGEYQFGKPEHPVKVPMEWKAARVLRLIRDNSYRRREHLGSLALLDGFFRYLPSTIADTRFFIDRNERLIKAIKEKYMPLQS